MTCPTCDCRLLSDAVYCHRCGTSFRVGGAPRYAGFWRRVCAVILDLLVVASPVFAVYDRVMPRQTPEEEQMTKDMFRHRLAPAEDRRARLRFTDRAIYFAEVTTFICGPYYVLSESSPLQATLGKVLLGMIVTDLNGRRIRRGRALRRFLARILSALPLQFGFLMAAFTPKKQALHDVVAGTLVVMAGASRRGNS